MITEHYLKCLAELENNPNICYVSNTKLSETIKDISNCLIVAEIEGTLKFISKMTVNPDIKK